MRSLPEIVHAALDSRLSELHTAMPARVVAYDAARNTVDVAPAFHHEIDDEDGNPTDEPLPTIPDVPIAWPRGGGAFITWPLAKGDPVLLVFCERDLGVWRAQGDAGPPGDRRMHTLAGAVALPGAFAESEALGASAQPPAETVVIGPKTALGASTASHPIPKGDAIVTALKALCDQIAAITVICAAPSNPSSVPANAAAILAIKATLDATLSGKHKIDG